MDSDPAKSLVYLYVESGILLQPKLSQHKHKIKAAGIIFDNHDLQSMPLNINDSQIAALIEKEHKRQLEGAELLPLKISLLKQ